MARTREELMKLNEMDPDLAKAVEENPLPEGATDFFDMREQRAAHLTKLRHLQPIPGPLPEVVETDQQIPVRDGSTIRVRIYTPKKSGTAGPLVVMYHEGGWSMGDLTDEELNCRMFCQDLNAVCVNVEYRLAPEHPFPTGINDSWDALQWAAANARSINANPTHGFIVGGGSAGGNIAAVLAHLARDSGLSPPLTGQYLCVPALLPSSVVPEKFKADYISRTANTNDPVIKDALKSRILYNILKPDESSPLFAPFNHPKGHEGLPAAYFQVCGMDPLRDEALIYERVLREECHVATKLDLYAGHGHYFWTNFPKLEMSKKFVADTLEGVRWLLREAEKPKSELVGG